MGPLTEKLLKLESRPEDEPSREERIKRFKEEIRPTAEWYNRFIAKYGLWGEDYRKW